jgi:uncharacterized protein
LAVKSVSLSHGESLGLVAKILGFHDWNELSAKIQSGRKTSAAQATAVNATNIGVPIFVRRDRPGPRPRTLPNPDCADICPSRRFQARRRAAADRLLLLVAQKRVEDDAPSFSDLHSVGVVSEMVDLTYLPDGKTVRIFVKALKRAAIAVPISGRCLTAQIDAVRETRGDTAEAVALRKAVLAKLQSYLNIDFSSPPYARLNAISEPGKLADAAVPVLRMSLNKAQRILETIDVIERLEKVLAAMNENKRVA